MCREKKKQLKMGNRVGIISVIKTLFMPFLPQLSTVQPERVQPEQRDDWNALARWALQELFTANLHPSCTRITQKNCTSLQHRSYILVDLLFFYTSHCEPTTYCPTTWDDFAFSLNKDSQNSTHYRNHLEMLLFLTFIVKSTYCRFKVHYIITLTSLSIT